MLRSIAYVPVQIGQQALQQIGGSSARLAIHKSDQLGLAVFFILRIDGFDDSIGKKSPASPHSPNELILFDRPDPRGYLPECLQLPNVLLSLIFFAESERYAGVNVSNVSGHRI